ncbi:MAG TPA: RNA polymerase sigma factor RpoD/SigA [Cyclobacteriaceae bacterium]|jgi:RNA polymerase primary sigma factor
MKQLKIIQQITNRESKSLDKYFTDISKVDLIDSDEEINLASRIREGDTLALEKLIKSNLRFVVSVAKQYQSNHMTLGDLINEGNVGLIKAATRFDETRGFKFISYAVWWIRQSIMQALAEQSRMVRLPLNRISSINKISKASSQLEQVLERDPTAEELAEVLDSIPDEIRNNMMISKRQISVDAPFVTGEENGLLEVIINTEIENPDSGLMRESLRQEIQHVLATLTERESKVLTMFYGLNGKSSLSLQEIADTFDLTRERVRQIKEKATRKLQKSSRSKILRNYL